MGVAELEELGLADDCLEVHPHRFGCSGRVAVEVATMTAAAFGVTAWAPGHADLRGDSRERAGCFPVSLARPLEASPLETLALLQARHFRWIFPLGSFCNSVFGAS